MPRLTADQWLEARQLWESDPRASFAVIAERFGVSDEAVRKQAAKQGWLRPEAVSQINRAAQARADAAEVGD